MAAKKPLIIHIPDYIYIYIYTLYIYIYLVINNQLIVISYSAQGKSFGLWRAHNNLPLPPTSPLNPVLYKETSLLTKTLSDHLYNYKL